MNAKAALNSHFVIVVILINLDDQRQIQHTFPSLNISR